MEAQDRELIKEWGYYVIENLKAPKNVLRFNFPISLANLGEVAHTDVPVNVQISKLGEFKEGESYKWDEDYKDAWLTLNAASTFTHILPYRLGKEVREVIQTLISYREELIRNSYNQLEKQLLEMSQESKAFKESCEDESEIRHYMSRIEWISFGTSKKYYNVKRFVKQSPFRAEFTDTGNLKELGRRFSTAAKVRTSDTGLVCNGMKVYELNRTNIAAHIAAMESLAIERGWKIGGNYLTAG